MSTPPSASTLSRMTRVIDGQPPKSYGTCLQLGSYWLIECEPHVMIALKRWIPRVDTMKTGQLRIRRSAEIDRDIQTFIDRYPLEMTPEDQRALHRGAESHRMNERVVASVLAGDYEPRTFELGVTPRDYQRVGADLFLRQKTLLLGDDLGLGKTITAITALSDPSTRPALVVTMPHLTEQWKREIQRALPGVRVHILEGIRPYDLRDAAYKDDKSEGRTPSRTLPDIYVTSYTRLAAWAGVLDGLVVTLVFDEVQELRHNDSAKYKGAQAIRQRAKGCLALSATPINNYGGEFFNVFDIIDPGCLGTEEEFNREWCSGSGMKRLITDPKAFGYYLRESGRMLRRTRREVGRELAAFTMVPHHIEADAAQLDSIAGRAGELARAILAGKTGKGAGFDLMKVSGELERLIRQATGIAKAPYVAAFLRMIVETDRKVVVAGWHRTFWDILEERLDDLKPVFFTGEETAKQKRHSFDEFLKTDGSMVLCMSLRAGTAGLDGLQKVCSTAAVGELDWSPAVHDQFFGRIHRDGQEDPCFGYMLLANCGSDPIVADVCGVKRGQSEPVRDPDAKGVVPTVDPNHVRKLAEAWESTRGRRR